MVSLQSALDVEGHRSAQLFLSQPWMIQIFSWPLHAFDFVTNLSLTEALIENKDLEKNTDSQVERDDMRSTWRLILPHFLLKL